MAEYMTYAEIIAAVERAIKNFKGTQETMIGEMINQAYLELAYIDELYLPFWLVDMDDTLKAVAPSILSGISMANPGIFTTSAAHGLSVGDIITIHAVVGMTEVNNRVFQIVTVPSTTQFATGFNTSGYTAYSSGGTVHHWGKTLSTPLKQVDQILNASWQGYTPAMTPITKEEIEADTNYQWGSTTQRPERFLHGKNYGSGGEIDQILWYPGSDANYNLRYWFLKRTVKMTNDGDVPTLPPFAHFGIVASTITRLIENNVEVNNAQIWPVIAAQHKETLTAYNRRWWKNHENNGKYVPYLL